MKMEPTQRSETLAYKIQTPDNYPEESIKAMCVFMLMAVAVHSNVQV
jgi:hypothetical protein